MMCCFLGELGPGHYNQALLLTSAPFCKEDVNATDNLWNMDPWIS